MSKSAENNLDPEQLQSHAWGGVLRFAGSILVLSVAFRNIGIDFTPLMQALTASVVKEVQHPTPQVQSVDPLIYDMLDRRLREVEKLAHKSGTTH